MDGERHGLFEAVFDALPLPALAVGRDGLVLAANPAAADLFAPGIIGSPLVELCVDPLDGHLVLAGLKARRAALADAAPLRTREGVVRARMQPVSAGGETGVVLFELAGEPAQRPGAPARDGAYALDLGGGRCLVSGVLAGPLDVGANNGETCCEDFLDAIHGEDRAAFDDALTAAGPEPFATARFSCRMRGPNDVWVITRHRVQVAARDNAGRPRRIAGVLRAEAGGADAVADHPDSLAQAVLASEFGAWTLNYATGVVRFSASARTMIGIETPGAVTLEAWRERIHPEDVQQCIDGVAAMAAGGAMDCCYRLIRPDGGVIWVEDKGRVTARTSDGAPQTAQGLIADVTQRRTLEEELRRYAGQLERSNRELDRFAQVASHDLQEPVRKIAAFALLVQRKYAGQLDAEGDQALSFLADAAGRMRVLIDDLLAYSRASSRALSTAPIDLGALALRASALALEEAGRPDVDVEIRELPTILGDEALLEAMLVNLLSNAVKYRGAEQPTVWVTAEAVASDPPAVRLTVRDNGIGLEPAFAEKIFQPFARLHGRETYPGTGIGLAICQQAAERHGGRIWVESEAGQGAAFHVELPGVALEPDEAAA